MNVYRLGNPGLGMQLTLQDFDNSGDPPSWLPAQKWEDVMAVSVLPGPLDSLCVHIANSDDAWKTWYQHSEPETLDLPISDDSETLDSP